MLVCVPFQAWEEKIMTHFGLPNSEGEDGLLINDSVYCDEVLFSPDRGN